MRFSRPACIGLVAVVALAARVVPLARTGSLAAIGSLDDGVYYAASRALWFGWLPYTDFTFVHPPGIIWLLAPASALEPWLGDAVAAGVGRLLIALLGTLIAALLAALAWRYGRAAALVAGLTYALMAAGSERTIFLETPACLGLVLSLCALRPALRGRRGWIWLAGAALSMALAMKLWAAGPACAVAAFVLIRLGWRALVGLLAGALAGAAVVAGPFLAADPVAAVQQTILAQGGRNRAPNSPGTVLGLFGPGGPAPAAVALAVGLTAAGLAVIVVLLRTPAARAALPEPTLWAGMAGAVLAEILISPSYFEHYWVFLWPWLALLAGLAAGRLAASTRWRRLRLPAAVGALGAGGALLVANLTGSPGWTSGSSDELTRHAHSDGCRFARLSSHLVAANALSDDLRRGCPFPLDWTGISLVLEAGGRPPETWPFAEATSREALFQAFERAAMSADTIVTRQVWADELDLAGRGWRDVGGSANVRVFRR